MLGVKTKTIKNLRFTGHRIEASDFLITMVGFAPNP